MEGFIIIATIINIYRFFFKLLMMVHPEEYFDGCTRVLWRSNPVNVKKIHKKRNF